MSRCYCTADLRPDGTCPYRCPPEANPRHLKRQARKRKANDALATRKSGDVTKRESRAVPPIGQAPTFRYGRRCS